jgi:hypothetical protein
MYNSLVSILRCAIAFKHFGVVKRQVQYIDVSSGVILRIYLMCVFWYARRNCLFLCEWLTWVVVCCGVLCSSF